jgi:Cu/Ag efflux pump CusA
MQQPLAIAIIAGLVFSLPLVLLVLPALLALFKIDIATDAAQREKDYRVAASAGP